MMNYTKERNEKISVRMMGNKNGERPLEERFWEKVDKSLGEDKCWLWTGAIRGKQGYGVIGIGSSKLYYAHRISLELFLKRKIKNGYYALHSDNCISRLCVNPNHLREGTHQDNMDDVVRLDLHARGERNGHSKLLDEDIIEIRRLSANGFSNSFIARKFYIAPQTVSKIVLRQRWKHI
jgi:hypothetical protein